MTQQFSAKHWAEKARKQATGTPAECPAGSAQVWAVGTIDQCPDGSAKHWAQEAHQTAQSIGNPANRDLSNLSAAGQEKLDAKQNVLTAGDNIEITPDGTIRAQGGGLPLFTSVKTGHILNNASYVNGRLFSWLPGTVYVSAYQELIKEMTGSPAGQITTQTLYAFQGPIVVYTKTLTLSENLPVYDETGEEIGYLVPWDNPSGYEFRWTQGAPDVDIGFSRLTGQDIVQTSGVTAEQKTQIIAGITIAYYVTPTKKKVCLADQGDNVAALYLATGAADFYLLDVANTQFKLPRRHTRRLLRSYKNGDEWYNLYSDGWCEQGGITKSGAVSNNNYTQPFLLTMADTNYWAIGAYTARTKTNAYLFIPDELYASRTRAGAVFRLDSEDNYWTFDGNQYLTWKVQGYADTSMLQDEFEYEYYFMGNTVQNQTALDVGALTQTVNNKADVDLSNAAPSAAFKALSMSWGVPDYSAPVSLTAGTTFTAPSNGFINGADARANTGSGVVKVQVNGVNIRIWEWQGNYAANTFQYMVGQNDKILITVSDAAVACVFYPVKGAVNV